MHVVRLLQTAVPAFAREDEAVSYTHLIENVAFDTFDFFLTRDRESDGRRIEIHRGGFEPTPAATADYNALAGQSAYTDRAGRFYYSNDGLVWAINIPFDIQHAYEKTDFLKAYPQMLE